jgi:hypothetical protein
VVTRGVGGKIGSTGPVGNVGVVAVHKDTMWDSG